MEVIHGHLSTALPEQGDEMAVGNFPPLKSNRTGHLYGAKMFKTF